jgi:hypothetical protein
LPAHAPVAPDPMMYLSPSTGEPGGAVSGSGATGAWAGKDLNVALSSSGVWVFLVPNVGWQAWDVANGIMLTWNGTAWVSASEVSDTAFVLKDNADPTKKAVFDLSSLTTGTTRTYTLPNVTGTVALLSGTQTFSGTTTFSDTFSLSGATVNLGTATAASTVNVGTGANASGVSKSINVGTGGASGSTTTLVFGSATAGALGTTTFNSPTITFSSLNTTINISGTTTLAGTATTATFLYLGLGGATPDATNRFSINSPAVLFNNAGSTIALTLNKNAAANDASFIFQTGFSTRALFGLLVDALHVNRLEFGIGRELLAVLAGVFTLHHCVPPAGFLYAGDNVRGVLVGIVLDLAGHGRPAGEHRDADKAAYRGDCRDAAEPRFEPPHRHGQERKQDSQKHRQR